MGFQVEWDDTDHSIVRYTIFGRWTWDEFYVARDQARKMVDTVAHDRVNVIIDLHSGNLFPQNALLHFRKMPSESHPKFANSTIVIIENNLFVDSLMNIMRRVNRQAMQNFYSARSLDAARTLLQTLQSSQFVAV